MWRIHGDAATDLMAGADARWGSLTRVVVEVAATDATGMDVDEDIVGFGDRSRALTNLEASVGREVR
jgi:hypothetical protein